MFDSASLLFKIYYFLNKYRFSTRARALLYELFQNIALDDEDLELLDTLYGVEIVLNLTPQKKTIKNPSPIPVEPTPITPRAAATTLDIPVISVSKVQMQSPQDESSSPVTSVDPNVVVI